MKNRVALEQRLEEGPVELQRLKQIAATQSQLILPQIEAAARILAQAQADLSLLE